MDFSRHERERKPFQRQIVRKVNHAGDSVVQNRADRIARHVVSIYEQLQDVREQTDDLFDLEIAQGGLSWEEHERRMLLEQKRAALVEELATLREQIASSGTRTF